MPSLATQVNLFHRHVQMEDDPDTIFRAVAAAGISAVEANLNDPHRMVDTLNQHGLKHAAVHVIARDLKEPQRWIDYLGITGARDICSSGFIEWEKRDWKGHEETAEILNRAGTQFRKAGIHLHYHNHQFELEERPTAGHVSLELLLDLLDPTAADLCVDVAWLHRAGVAPASFLREHASSIGYLHLKDWNGAEWVPPGQGTVDLEAVLSVVPHLPHLRWMALEQDEASGDPTANMLEAGRWASRNLPSLVNPR